MADGGAMVSVHDGGGARGTAAARFFCSACTEGGRRKGDGVRGERRLRGVLEYLAA
jgi:hypothetical protein